MSNAQALRAVLDHVREHPTAWKQEWWSECFAGQALRVLLGATAMDSACCPGSKALAVPGEPQYCGYHIGVRAAQLLDLTPHQAERLFGGDNSLRRLADLIEEFTKKEAVPPEMALSA
ncbi:hypothetical protein [Streptomyces sp. NPDC010273]|uniref:hypothetical protein n=1 Tax=Streptomyces sp. NPDC010273 TaxID=3364829 RepID=UPI0036EBBF16